MNARLDEETAAALRRLVRSTGLSVTDVLKLSLLRLSEQQTGSAQPAAEAFAELVGCFEGPPELSERYKDELAASLERKHDAP